MGTNLGRLGVGRGDSTKGFLIPHYNVSITYGRVITQFQQHAPDEPAEILVATKSILKSAK
jgi:hypothetical protein